MQISMNSAPLSEKSDKISETFRSIAQEIIAVVFGLLPLLFIPAIAAPLGYTKAFLVATAVFVALIFYSLSVLRSGTLKVALPQILLGFWAIALATVLAALFSGDLYDSFIGDALGDRTAIFVTLLALSATTIVAIGQSKSSVMRLYLLLTTSAVILTAYHTLRLIFGPETLTFKVFNNAVATPVGGWNDLGLLCGLIVILSLIAVEQLPLTKWGRVLFSAVVALALMMLAVVNFFAVWVIMALVGLVALMYALTKDRRNENTVLGLPNATPSMWSISLAGLVSVVSIIFILGGSTVGGAVAKITGVTYVEVRPSVEATIDIGRSVYQDNILFGTGPNRFVDAWRQFKNPVINQTRFWNTDFTAGSGYIPTLMVTTGLVGVFAWLFFLAVLVRSSYRIMFVFKTTDRFWYFIASSAAVAAIYLWLLAWFYVPGPTIMLLAGMFTGVLAVAYVAIAPTPGWQLSLTRSRQAGVVLVASVMVVIVGSTTALYFLGQHYRAVYSYNSALASIGSGVSVEAVEQKIAAAYEVTKNDLYARQIAQYELSKLRTLLTIAEPTTEQQQQFQQAAVAAVNTARLAVSADPTDAYNQATLGAIYSLLAATGFEGAAEQASASLGTAKQLDPTNPLYYLIEAQQQAQLGDYESAKANLEQAVALKPDYTDALFLLTQIDIALGDLDGAISATRSIIVLDSQNPARHYQLGVLLSSAGNRDEAVESFRRAIALDPNYANAHYFLGIAYAEAGERDAAIAEFTIVRDLNPENAGVSSLISALQNGTSSVSLNTQNQVAEPDTVKSSDDTVITNSETDTSLIKPVNTIPDTSTTEPEPTE